MNRIKEARIAAGLSVAELARRAGIASSNLSAIEGGTRQASAVMEQRILDATGRPSGKLRSQRGQVLTLIAQMGGVNPQVFGSVARGEDTVGSDLDILAGVAPGRIWDFITLPRLLTDLLGVPVDVIDAGGLRGETGNQILAEAVPL